MNSETKAGLSFGIGMAIFYIAYDLISRGVDRNGSHLLIVIIIGVIDGIISGILFGWLIGKFSKSRFVSITTKIDTGAEEEIIFQTAANHFKGIEGVGGKLYLTNKRLVFKSHKLNIQTHELSVSLEDIQDINRYKTLGIVNNGLSIQTAQKTEKFIVEKTNEWLKQLTDIKYRISK